MTEFLLASTGRARGPGRPRGILRGPSEAVPDGMSHAYPEENPVTVCGLDIKGEGLTTWPRPYTWDKAAEPRCRTCLTLVAQSIAAEKR